MAIFSKDKEITSINWGEKAISSVYYGAKLVWEMILSCFGKGWWVNDKPWSNKDAWKN